MTVIFIVLGVFVGWAGLIWLGVYLTKGGEW